MKSSLLEQRLRKLITDQRGNIKLALYEERSSVTTELISYYERPGRTDPLPCYSPTRKMMKNTNPSCPAQASRSRQCCWCCSQVFIISPRIVLAECFHSSWGTAGIGTTEYARIWLVGIFSGDSVCLNTGLNTFLRMNKLRACGCGIYM